MPYKDHPEFLEVIPKGKQSAPMAPFQLPSTRVKNIHFTREMLDRLKMEVTESLPEEGKWFPFYEYT
jgi:hypothetical protein